MQIQWCGWGVSKYSLSRGDGCFDVVQVTVYMGCFVLFLAVFFFELPTRAGSIPSWEASWKEVSFLKSARGFSDGLSCWNMLRQSGHCPLFQLWIANDVTSACSVLHCQNIWNTAEMRSQCYAASGSSPCARVALLCVYKVWPHAWLEN